MGYEDGKIYKIKCGDFFYHGSCITSLERRATTHRYKAKKLQRKLYNYIKDKEWSIELVCNAPCATKLELLQKEDEYIKTTLSDPFCLNERSATWDKEKDKQRKKIWYEANKERILKKDSDKQANMLHC